MVTTISPCRTYIVYHHGLFAQGVRTILEKQNSIQIVGMQKNVDKALKAVESLRPEVILVEEPTEMNTEWPFLKLAATGRVVTLSLDHAYATVCEQHRIPASDPAELVRAIRGVPRGKQPETPGRQPKERKAQKATRTKAGRPSLTS